MSRHRGALRDMGDISLLGVVDIMTGEKDPRNLMIVFSILRVIMVEWDISNHTEVCVAFPGGENFDLTPGRLSSTLYTIISRSRSDLHPTIPMGSLHMILKGVSRIVSLLHRILHPMLFPHYWTSLIQLPPMLR